MKKVQLFFIGTVLLAAASAFTNPIKTSDEFVLIEGRYELVSEQPEGGHCDDLDGSICKYEKIANNGSDPYVEPTNFSPLDTDQVWVP